MKNEFLYIALTKDEQQYFFRFSPGTEAEILQTIITYARDPEYNLDWFDVVLFIKKMRSLMSAGSAGDPAGLFPEETFNLPDDWQDYA